jgi:hypothetical protein
VLLALQRDDVKLVTELITYGVSSTDHYYIVIGKYGSSLKDMLRHSKYQRFSIKTSVQIGI